MKKTVNSAYLDSNYSKITKIVIPNTMNSPILTRSLSSQDDTMQRECEKAQKLYRQSLEEAEQEKEEKNPNLSTRTRTIVPNETRSTEQRT